MITIEFVMRGHNVQINVQIETKMASLPLDSKLFEPNKLKFWNSLYILRHRYIGLITKRSCYMIKTSNMFKSAIKLMRFITIVLNFKTKVSWLANGLQGLSQYSCVRIQRCNATRHPNPKMH